MTAENIGFLRACGIEGAVVNGTSEKDWPEVAALARAFPDFVIPSFGLHPWMVKAASPVWRKNLSHWLDVFPQAAVGEIGLDNWIKDADLPAQKQAFAWQWQLAAERKRPVTVHCLKAWDAMFAGLAELPPHPDRVLFHGISCAADIARRLICHGCLLGFGGHLLAPRKARARDVFATLPEEAILLETDAPQMAGPEASRRYFLANCAINHPANLVVNGEALAALRGLEPAALAVGLRANTRRWLGESCCPDFLAG